MKNRFKYYKGPSISDADFAELFKSLNVSGFSFTGETESQDVERTFCSCGFSSKESYHSCPKCGKRILGLSRCWGNHGYTHAGSIYDILENPKNPDELNINYVVININAEKNNQYFGVGVNVKPIATVTPKIRGPKVTAIEKSFPCDTGFVADGLSLLYNRVDGLKEMVKALGRITSCQEFVALLNCMYYLPRVYNIDNINKHGDFLRTQICQNYIFKEIEIRIPKCPDIVEEYEYYWDNEGEKFSRSTTFEEFVWLCGIPTNVGNIDKFSSELASWKSGWAARDKQECENYCKARKFFDTDFGKYIVHRYISVGFRSNMLLCWGTSAEDFVNKYEFGDLFENWIKEYADLISIEFSTAKAEFISQCEILQRLGYRPDEDLLRQRRYKAIVNSTKYNLNEYLDFDKEIKNPTQMIISMANILEEDS